MEPIDSSLGVYFEKIAPIRLYNNEWHIIFHMNLTTIQEEFTSIQVSVQKADELCHALANHFKRNDSLHVSYPYTRECGSTLAQVKLMLGDIEDFNVDWFHGNTNNRPKRGAFNIVGTVLNSLFGTLAQEDAEKYLERFTQMEQNQVDTQSILDQQTTLIQSTTQILHKISEDNSEFYTETQNKFQVIDNILHKLASDYENLWLNLEMRFQMENLLTFISLTLTSFHETQRQFLEALALGSNRHTQAPIVLPPALLLRELNNIKAHITGQDLDLPLPISKDTIPNFYQIASTTSRILNGQLLISMSIPIVSLQEYELIKLTSFPHKIPNGLYSFILPAHEYIAIDSFREKFITLSNQELENCHDLRYNTARPEIICMQSSPIIQVSPNRDDCSITLLTKNHQINNCDIRISNITSEVFLKLRQQNSWIYVFPQQQGIYIRCNNLPTLERVIEGTGIITIKPDCQIKTNEILIQGHTIYNSEVYQEMRPTITPNFDFNLTTLQLELNIESEIKKLDSPNVISFGETDKLKKLSNNVEELQTSRHTRHTKRNYDSHRVNYHRILIWLIILTIVAILSVYLLLQTNYYVNNRLFTETELQSYLPSNVDVNPPPSLETTV